MFICSQDIIPSFLVTWKESFPTHLFHIIYAESFWRIPSNFSTSIKKPFYFPSLPPIYSHICTSHLQPLGFLTPSEVHLVLIQENPCFNQSDKAQVNGVKFVANALCGGTWRFLETCIVCWMIILTTSY